jgi:FkbM family methyltransferase
MFDSVKREIKLSIAQRYWNLKGNFKYYSEKVYFPKNSVIFKRAVKEGIYEHDVVSIIVPLIKPGTEVFDIGANIGIMAIPMLSSDKSIKVVSVEASPNSLSFLKKTNLASTYKDRWIIIDKAVSQNEGKIRFHIADQQNGAYDSINDTKRISFKNTIEIACTTIDHIWESRNKPMVSLIKSDIEGADLLALKGGINCIKQCKPSIMIEWNSANIKPFGLQNADLFNFAQSVNYTMFSVPALNKITSLTDLELQSNYSENFLLISDEQ